jgi:beta-carotene ketolase (CrtW type)
MAMLNSDRRPASITRFAKPEPWQGVIGMALMLLIFVSWLGLHIYAIAFFEINSATAPFVPLIFLLLCWLSVGLFIIAHDAMHGSLVPGWPRLSACVGALMLFVYAGFGWRKLRDAHMDHHKYSGTDRDPDFDAKHPTSFWPWYLTFLRRYFGPVSLIYVVAVTWGYLLIGKFAPVNVVLLYGAPAIVSSFQLFYFGTYLPHRHFEGGDFADRHNARTAAYGGLASLLSCFHFGYHHEHHLSPYVPWWGLPARREAGRQTPDRHPADALSYDVR